ncbi:MAG: alpha/beta hydrolase [Deltaproteobacteria bacterium]|nr:MAG: alpha/beta hydrolase [Deltaproteobacteria bacterium]
MALSSPLNTPEAVILLHGLARTRSSMEPLARYLRQQGYGVINDGYPSRKYTVEVLAETAIPRALSKVKNAPKVHFVTHSMGGILVRYYLSQHPIENLGRIVMISPPNQGSEAVDRLGEWFAFKWLNGPAGNQLGTGKDSLPNRLGPTTADVGIITGNRSINWILSSMIDGPDDGKVSVKRAQLEGMKAFRVVSRTHPFIMKAPEVMEMVVRYLKTGDFSAASTAP